MLILSLRRRGFTIAELIIVMMIIVLLVAILLPALSSARARAKRVAAQAQLTSIVAACESYQLSFGSAPGYVSEAELTQGPDRTKFSSNENLVLSLLGQTGGTGEYINDQIDSTPIKFDVTKIGTGPKSVSGQVFGAFYSPKPDELGVVTGTKWNGDNAIPELLDPNTGMPLSYFRAVKSGTTPVGTDENSTGKYLIYGNLEFYASDTLVAPDGTAYDQAASSLMGSDVAGSWDNAAQNLSWFAVNSKLSTISNGTASSANNTNDVLNGQFMVMSPGSDGIYLHKDQLDSGTLINHVDDLDLFDDLVASGG